MQAGKPTLRDASIPTRTRAPVWLIGRSIFETIVKSKESGKVRFAFEGSKALLWCRGTAAMERRGKFVREFFQTLCTTRFGITRKLASGAAVLRRD